MILVETWPTCIVPNADGSWDTALTCGAWKLRSEQAQMRKIFKGNMDGKAREKARPEAEGK